MAQRSSRKHASPAHAVRVLSLGACLASCGGGGQDVVRPAPHPTPALARAEPAPEAALTAPRDPSDALSEQLGSDRAAAQSLDERFPLHGVAVHMIAQVFAEPRLDAEVLGYLRRGARVRAGAGIGGNGGGRCPRRFHELSTGGFVCDGQGFLIGKGPQRFEPSPPPPALYDALPYRYAKTRDATLQYWRVPTRLEERDALARLAASPELATLAARVPNATALLELPDYLRMAMEPGFYVSVDRDERVMDDATPVPLAVPLPPEAMPAAGAVEVVRPDAATRAFARTVRGAYVPSESLEDISPPAGIGVVLGDDLRLPLGIVHRASAKAWVPDALGAEPRPTEPLPRFSAISLVAEAPPSLGRERVLARSGALIARSGLRIATPVVRPPLVPRRARLIHVRLAEQTLVAYEGDRPVFATLVSSGKPGFETPAGVFRIYAKHVSTTMDGVAPRTPTVMAATGGTKAAPSTAPAAPTASAVGTAADQDEAYSIEDVAWTMYFSGNYALHAAFWHDKFGNVRSHGCVNLAPADARWLFRWATPELPAEWHGVQATRDNPGTWVFIE